MLIVFETDFVLVNVCGNDDIWKLYFSVFCFFEDSVGSVLISVIFGNGCTRYLSVYSESDLGLVLVVGIRINSVIFLYVPVLSHVFHLVLCEGRY